MSGSKYAHSWSSPPLTYSTLGNNLKVSIRSGPVPSSNTLFVFTPRFVHNFRQTRTRPPARVTSHVRASSPFRPARRRFWVRPILRAPSNIPPAPRGVFTRDLIGRSAGVVSSGSTRHSGTRSRVGREKRQKGGNRRDLTCTTYVHTHTSMVVIIHWPVALWWRRVIRSQSSRHASVVVAYKLLFLLLIEIGLKCLENIEKFSFEKYIYCLETLNEEILKYFARKIRVFYMIVWSIGWFDVKINLNINLF